MLDAGLVAKQCPNTNASNCAPAAILSGHWSRPRNHAGSRVGANISRNGKRPRKRGKRSTTLKDPEILFGVIFFLRLKDFGDLLASMCAPKRSRNGKGPQKGIKYPRH